MACQLQILRSHFVREFLKYLLSSQVFLISLLFFFFYVDRWDAKFPAIGDRINSAIVTLYSFAESALDAALLHHFNESDEPYCSMLTKVDHLLATAPDGEEARAAVRYLQRQHDFFYQHLTFEAAQPGVFPPTVEILQKLIDCMKLFANRIGLSECAKEIGSYLYDPEGEETQDIFGGSTFVPRKCCTTNDHLQMSKLAASFAHPPPDPEVVRRNKSQLVKSLLDFKICIFFSGGKISSREIWRTRKSVEQGYPLSCFLLLQQKK